MNLSFLKVLIALVIFHTAQISFADDFNKVASTLKSGVQYRLYMAPQSGFQGFVPHCGSIIFDVDSANKQINYVFKAWVEEPSGECDFASPKKTYTSMFYPQCLASPKIDAIRPFQDYTKKELAKAMPFGRAIEFNGKRRNALSRCFPATIGIATPTNGRTAVDENNSRAIILQKVSFDNKAYPIDGSRKTYDTVTFSLSNGLDYVVFLDLSQTP